MHNLTFNVGYGMNFTSLLFEILQSHKSEMCIANFSTTSTIAICTKRHL